MSKREILKQRINRKGKSPASSHPHCSQILPSKKAWNFLGQERRPCNNNYIAHTWMLFIYLYHSFSVLKYFFQLPDFLRQYCQQQIEALQLPSDFSSVITFNKGVVATTHFPCFLFIYSTYSYLASTHPHHSFEILMLIFLLCFLSSLSTWSFDGISNVFTIFQNSIPLALAIALSLHTLWLILVSLLSTSAFSTWFLNVEIPQNLFLIFTFISYSILFRSYPCQYLMAIFDAMSLGQCCHWCSVAQACLTLWPHGLQDARLPCPSQSPGACSNSHPLSQWCHPTISSSVIPFSPCLQSFPASWSFPESWLFASAQSILARSLSFSISPYNEFAGLVSFRIDWFGLAVQGIVKSIFPYHSLKASVLWPSAFFMVQLSHPYMNTGKTIA